jgi:Cdc6-like AAA superfamily ATPase
MEVKKKGKKQTDPQVIPAFRISKFIRQNVQEKPFLLLYGLGGEGKTFLTKNTLEKLGFRVIYYQLPIGEREAQNLLKLVEILSEENNRKAIVIDELTALNSRDCFIKGLIKKLIDVAIGNSHVKIVGICNEVWILKEEHPDLWRRIEEHAATYYTDPPFTMEEMLVIWEQLLEKAKREQTITITPEQLRLLAEETAMQGFNYSAIETILRTICKPSNNKEPITFRWLTEAIKNYLETYNVPFTAEAVSNYIHKLRVYKIPFKTIWI